MRTSVEASSYNVGSTTSNGGRKFHGIDLGCLLQAKAWLRAGVTRTGPKPLPPLRAEGLVTDRKPIVMRCADGTIVEIFEWVSQDVITGAHKNHAVLELWKKFEAVCWYETPANIPEFKNMFSHFEPV